MEEEARHPLNELPSGPGAGAQPRDPTFAIALAACAGCVLLALALA